MPWPSAEAMCAVIVWSMLVNFERESGYDGFGRAHVAYHSLLRIPKPSFAWYATLIRTPLQR
jgi:beta-glucosidase